jgi:hypothetical protein
VSDVEPGDPTDETAGPVEVGPVEVPTGDEGAAAAHASASATAEQHSGATAAEAEEHDDPRSPAVAVALQELGRLSKSELSEHPEIYQRIHAELQGALTSIDDA